MKKLAAVLASVVLAFALSVGFASLGMATPMAASAAACAGGQYHQSLTTQSVFDPYYGVWTTRVFAVEMYNNCDGTVTIQSWTYLSDMDPVYHIQAQLFVYTCIHSQSWTARTDSEYWSPIAETEVTIPASDSNCLQADNGSSYINDPGYTGFGTAHVDTGWVWNTSK